MSHFHILLRAKVKLKEQKNKRKKERKEEVYKAFNITEHSF